MLAGGHQNVCVVGDTDQCLPPGHDGVDAERARWRSRRSRSVMSSSARRREHGASGNRGARSRGSVRRSPRLDHRRRSDDLGDPASPRTRPARAATRHVSRLSHVPRRPWLAHRPHDRARPIGKVARTPARNRSTPMRLDPEDVQHDGEAVLRVVSRRVRLPTAASIRPVAISLTTMVAAALRSIDTETRAKLLMEDRLLHAEFPHHRRAARARSTINLTMFSIGAPSRLPPGAMVVESSRCRRAAGRAVRRSPSKHRSVRYETSWKDYGGHSTTPSGSPIGGLDIRRRIAIDRTIYDLMPFSPCACPAWRCSSSDDGDLLPTSSIDVEFVPYSGPGVRPRGRCHAHVRSPTACWSTTACTASVGRTSGTSSSSRRRSPTSPRSCSTRTTAARRRSSTRRTR